MPARGPGRREGHRSSPDHSRPGGARPRPVSRAVVRAVHLADFVQNPTQIPAEGAPGSDLLGGTGLVAARGGPADVRSGGARPGCRAGHRRRVTYGPRLDRMAAACGPALPSHFARDRTRRPLLCAHVRCRRGDAAPAGILHCRRPRTADGRRAVSRRLSTVYGSRAGTLGNAPSRHRGAAPARASSYSTASPSISPRSLTGVSGKLSTRRRISPYSLRRSVLSNGMALCMNSDR